MKRFVYIGILFILPGFHVKGQDTSKVLAAIELARMNVLYLGLDNPVKIVVSGFDPSDIEVSIDNGTITGSNGDYNVRPKELGTATIVLSSKGKEIHRSDYRVKRARSIVIVLCTDDRKGVFEPNEQSKIWKSILLNVNRVEATLEDSDYDVQWEVVQFNLASIINDTVVQAISYSDKFTEEQKAIISKTKAGDKIYIEEITVKGEDGVRRKVGPVNLEIF